MEDVPKAHEKESSDIQIPLEHGNVKSESGENCGDKTKSDPLLLEEDIHKNCPKAMQGGTEWSSHLEGQAISECQNEHVRHVAEKIGLLCNVSEATENSQDEAEDQIGTPISPTRLFLPICESQQEFIEDFIEMFVSEQKIFAMAKAEVETDALEQSLGTNVAPMKLPRRFSHSMIEQYALKRPSAFLHQCPSCSKKHSVVCEFDGQVEPELAQNEIGLPRSKSVGPHKVKADAFTKQFKQEAVLMENDAQEPQPSLIRQKIINSKSIHMLESSAKAGAINPESKTVVASDNGERLGSMNNSRIPSRYQRKMALGNNTSLKTGEAPVTRQTSNFPSKLSSDAYLLHRKSVVRETPQYASHQTLPKITTTRNSNAKLMEEIYLAKLNHQKACKAAAQGCEMSSGTTDAG